MAYETRTTSYGWEKVDPRFNAKDPAYVNEPNRFGYIVEIDPENPRSVPRKHTAMGRFKHEGANIRVDKDGTVVAYMGDDERFDYLYKFVAKNKYRPGKSAAARRRNKRLLTEGDLYVAKFNGTLVPDDYNLGDGTWLQLTRNGASMVPGMTIEEVLRLHPAGGRQVGGDADGPVRGCRAQPGHRQGLRRLHQQHRSWQGGQAQGPMRPIRGGRTRTATSSSSPRRATGPGPPAFTWNIFMLCGDTDDTNTYFAGWTGPVAPISCPDNLAFDGQGHLWVATDGAARHHREGRRPVPGAAVRPGARPRRAVPRGAEPKPRPAAR